MNSIESQFVPYEIAVKLKELGFDGGCLAYWHPNEYLVFRENVVWDLTEAPNAPLWQQAFDWFRVEHGVNAFVSHALGSINIGEELYCFTICWPDILLDELIEKYYVGEYPTYESARLACLEKLIELVTEKQQGV